MLLFQLNLEAEGGGGGVGSAIWFYGFYDFWVRF